MKKAYLVSFLIIISFVQIFPQDKKPITSDDLWAMKRIGGFDLSPDGKTIAFTVTQYSMETNKGNKDIMLINSDGSDLRPLKNSAENESDPKFSPDGKHIAYVYKDQIWLCDYDGKNDVQLTDLYTGASGIVWSNDGTKMLFVSSVYPDCTTQDCNKEKDEAEAKSKVKAKIFTELMYRHWNEWRGDKRSHLFLLNVETKETTDLTLNSEYDVPPLALGSSKDYNFSPDGNEVAFTMNISDFPATSTNNDIFIINLKDVVKGEPAPQKKISTSRGNDNQPLYSPDGQYIAFCSMEHAGFEADKQNLMLYNRKTEQTINISGNMDYSIGEMTWSPDSKYLYFTTANEIYNSIFKIDISEGQYTDIQKTGVNGNIVFSPTGDTLYFTQQRSTLPDEIFSKESDDDDPDDITQLTSINKELLSDIEWGEPVDTFWCAGANGRKIQSIIVRPPNFDSSQKYPMIFLIHGGPQGHWEDDFHYRWNTQMFASKGYVVVATNFTGSTGYGQKFTNDISKHWGDAPYVDLMNACDYALKTFKYIDPKNVFAAGASYGGYMINWIEGHTDRFNALVCHDGVFNLESMYGSTEELWFPEWEFGGTPWTNRALYEKFSPHQFVQNFKTPMLVIHGAQDFRVPEDQAFELFTSLQRMGVESKFLYFPDEYHFVVKPQNAKLWWDTIFRWFEDHKVK